MLFVGPFHAQQELLWLFPGRQSWGIWLLAGPQNLELFLSFWGFLHAPEIGVSWLFPCHQICFGFLYAHLQILCVFPLASPGECTCFYVLGFYSEFGATGAVSQAFRV